MGSFIHRINLSGLSITKFKTQVHVEPAGLILPYRIGDRHIPLTNKLAPLKTNMKETQGG